MADVTRIIADDQEFELATDKASSDETLRKAISRVLPAWANCEIKRGETDKTTGQAIIRLTKRAGTKGLVAPQVEAAGGPGLWLVPPCQSTPILAALRAAPAEMSDTLTLVYAIFDRQDRGEAFSIEDKIRWSPRINELRDEVKKSHEAVEAIIKRLRAAPPVATSKTPEGF